WRPGASRGYGRRLYLGRGSDSLVGAAWVARSLDLTGSIPYAPPRLVVSIELLLTGRSHGGKDTYTCWPCRGRVPQGRAFSNRIRGTGRGSAQRDLRGDCSRRNCKALFLRDVPCALEERADRPQPEDGGRGTDSSAPGHDVQGIKRAEEPHLARPSGEEQQR